MKKLKRYSIMLPEDLHRQAKLRACELGIPLQDYIANAVIALIKEKKEKKDGSEKN